MPSGAGADFDLAEVRGKVGDHRSRLKGLLARVRMRSECRVVQSRTMYPRIVSDLGILGGKPIIRGTRISVEFILELCAGGASHSDVLRLYPHLAPQDVEEALRYAADVVSQDIVLPPRMTG